MGTVFCHHHDEDDLVGADPAPCPFCGHGAEDEAPVGSDELEALNIEDSSSALQRALDAEPSKRSSSMTSDRRLPHYW